MKTCPRCGKQAEDNTIFCPFCGAEFVSTKKKMTYIEKKQQKEAEQRMLLEKSYISVDQLNEAKDFDIENLVIEKKNKLDKTKSSAIARIVVAVIITLGALAWAFVSINSNIDNNFKLVIIFAAFISIFCAASIFISDLHLVLTLQKMQKSVFAVKKIKYGKPPVVAFNGDLYEVNVSAKCSECFNDMHIEEVEGSFVAVCNANRNHVFKIDFEKVHSKYFVMDK